MLVPNTFNYYIWVHTSWRILSEFLLWKGPPYSFKLQYCTGTYRTHYSPIFSSLKHLAVFTKEFNRHLPDLRTFSCFAFCCVCDLLLTTLPDASWQKTLQQARHTHRTHHTAPHVSDFAPLHPTRSPRAPMSGYLIDHVESRLDAMNQGIIHDVPITVRDPAAPPISPTGGVRRRRHTVKPKRRSLTMPANFYEESATESLHENFGWLEQYVDCRMKQDSIRSLASLGFTWSSDEEITPPLVTKNHRHRRTLSRRDSLVDEVGESLIKLPLDNVAEEAESQVVVPDGICKKVSPGTLE